MTMSADNWDCCPRCVSEHEANIVKARIAANEALGKVPPEEYMRMLSVIKETEQFSLGNTFREDYEIDGASEGIITVDYSGHCTVCNLVCHFTHEVRFFPEVGK